MCTCNLRPPIAATDFTLEVQTQQPNEGFYPKQGQTFDEILEIILSHKICHGYQNEFWTCKVELQKESRFQGGVEAHVYVQWDMPRGSMCLKD